MILNVNNLNVNYKNKNKFTPIIKNISFQVKKNTCLGILGESGSGKSMIWKAITGVLDKNFEIDGDIKFNGESLSQMNKKKKKDLLGKNISIIIQNPMTAFDPLFKIKSQMIESFKSHNNMKKKEAYNLAFEVLTKLKIKNPHDTLNKYPHELSGGMLQRIMIGISIALNPSIIIADEPTTAIDTINQVEVLKELKMLRDNFGISMIFITHDIGVISEIADEIIVLNKGKIVEYGPVKEILNNPKSKHGKYLVNTRIKLLNQFEKYTKEGDIIATRN